MIKKYAFSLVSLLACFASQQMLAAPTQPANAKHKPQQMQQARSHHQVRNYQQMNKAQAAAPQATSTTSTTVMPVFQQLNAFKLQPRVSIWGLTGNYTLAQGQVLLPFSGDQNKVFYGLVEGNIVAHDDTRVIGMGLGYRQIVNDRIYGGYFITDYARSIGKNSFIVANPGIEILGKVWDFNFNAYIPLNNERTSSKLGWAADDFNKYDYLRFTGYNQYDHKLQEFEQAGRGLDFRVGRVIPHLDKAKAYLGGYYFSTKDAGSIQGVSAKITYELNQYTAIELTDTYDNYNKNKALFGVKLTLGGYSDKEKKDFGLSSRLLDTIDHGYGTTIVPIKKIFADKGEALQHDKVLFFKDGGISGDGTFEHPLVFSLDNYNYAVAKSKTIGTIDTGAHLYFAPGTYVIGGATGFNSNAGGRLEWLIVSPDVSEIRGIDYANLTAKFSYLGIKTVFFGSIEIDGSASPSLYRHLLDVRDIKIELDNFSLPMINRALLINNANVNLYSVDIFNSALEEAGYSGGKISVLVFMNSNVTMTGSKVMLIVYDNVETAEEIAAMRLEGSNLTLSGDNGFILNYTSAAGSNSNGETRAIKTNITAVDINKGSNVTLLAGKMNASVTTTGNGGMGNVDISGVDISDRSSLNIRENAILSSLVKDNMSYSHGAQSSATTGFDVDNAQLAVGGTLDILAYSAQGPETGFDMTNGALVDIANTAKVSVDLSDAGATNPVTGYQATPKSVNGIHVSADSSLRRNGVEVPQNQLSSLTDRVKINGGELQSIAGYKIIRDGKDYLPW